MTIPSENLPKHAIVFYMASACFSLEASHPIGKDKRRNAYGILGPGAGRRDFSGPVQLEDYAIRRVMAFPIPYTGVFSLG